MSQVNYTSNYQKCFVAYLDILGFSKMINDSKIDPDIITNIASIIQTCNIIPKSGSITKKEITRSGVSDVLEIRSNLFSDSIILYIKDEVQKLPQLLLIIRFLQDRLWELGVCVRGAVTLGAMYWREDESDLAAFGPGLLDAIYYESQLAVYPRILIAQEVYASIEDNSVDSWPIATDKLLQDFIIPSPDGLLFLDLLNPDIIRSEIKEIETNSNIFSINLNSKNNHYQEIITKVSELCSEYIDSADKKIQQKYEWLLSYLKSKKIVR